MELPQINYDGFQVKNGSPIKLLFTDKYIKYEAWSDNIWRNPETELDEEKHFENILYLAKDKICSIELQWCTQLKHYDVLIRTSAADYICIKLDNYDQAATLQKTISNYTFYNIIPE